MFSIFRRKCKHPFNSIRIHLIRSELNEYTAVETFTILAECTMCNKSAHRVHEQLTYPALIKTMRDKVDEELRNRAPLS